MQYFNLKQIEKIQEIIKSFHTTNNNIGTNNKIDNIKMYKDDENNFYVSYLGTYFGPDGETVGEYYLKVDANGNQTRLNYEMNNLELKEFFKTLKQITL